MAVTPETSKMNAGGKDTMAGDRWVTAMVVSEGFAGNDAGATAASLPEFPFAEASRVFAKGAAPASAGNRETTASAKRATKRFDFALACQCIILIP